MATRKNSAALRLVDAAQPSPPAAAAVTGAGLAEIPLELLEPSAFNARTVYLEETIADLATSIAAQGLLQNLLVRPTAAGYEVLSGERRRRALLLLLERGDLPAGYPVACRVVDVDDTAALLASATENAARENPPWWDEAAAFRRVYDVQKAAGKTGITTALAAAAGCVRRRVEQLIAVDRKLVPGALELAKAGKMTFAQARAWAGLEPVLQEALLTLDPVPSADDEASLRNQYQRFRKHVLLPNTAINEGMREDLAGLRTFGCTPYGYTKAHTVVLDGDKFLRRRDARLKIMIDEKPGEHVLAAAREQYRGDAWTLTGAAPETATTAFRMTYTGEIETQDLAALRQAAERRGAAVPVKEPEPEDNSAETTAAFRLRAAAMQQSAARKAMLASRRMMLEFLALLVIGNRAFADVQADRIPLDPEFEKLDQADFAAAAATFPKPIAKQLGDLSHSVYPYHDGPKSDQVARAIHALTDDELFRLLAVGSSFFLRTTRPCPNQTCGTSATLLHLVEAFGIAIDPKILRPGHLAGLRKARLVELAIAAGAAGADEERELQKLRVADLTKLIVEKRRPGWLPPELDFHPPHPHNGAGHETR